MKLFSEVKASPLIKPFLTPGGWQEVKFVYQLESFCRFEVRAHLENGPLVNLFIIYAGIQESYFSI